MGNCFSKPSVGPTTKSTSDSPSPAESLSPLVCPASPPTPTTSPNNTSQHLPLTTTKIHPRNEATPENHTMGASLPRYLEIKVHQAVLARAYREIIVIGAYRRHSPDSIPFTGEKTDKPFNWERPTARVDGKTNTLYIECFPGYDHVEHYAEIVSVWLKLRERQQEQGGYVYNLTPASRVSFVPASCSDTLAALARDTNLAAFPGRGVHTVVLGQVWHLPRMTRGAEWTGDGAWQWIVRTTGRGGKRVAFLGFRAAFWGDISGEVVHFLSHRFGIEEVVYLGKLGGLDPTVRPNTRLATGGRSLVHGRWVCWDNVLADAVARRAAGETIVGRHVTLGSVLHETRAWRAQLGEEGEEDQGVGVDFVDPEIGMMAQAAVRCGMRFGYLHMVTDNLGRRYDEDLSNEREERVVRQRERLRRVVEDVMVEYLGVGS